MSLRGLGALLLLVLLPSALRAEYFTIREYVVNVRITPEGYADFEEVLRVEFTEPRHGIFRFIPYRDDIGGKRVDRYFEEIDVEQIKFSSFKENLNMVIKIGDADKYVDGLQTYTITYRIINPLNFFEQNTEFYWDLIGTAWEVPIEQIRFSITFPDKVLLTRDDVRCFTGGAGKAGEDVTFSVQPNGVTGQTTRAFSYGEGLTVAVNLDKDVFKPMSGWRWFLKRHGLLLAPIAFLIGAFYAMYHARNRRMTIMTEYFPPDGISPAIAGGFVDHSVDSNDVLSLIPHLANMGYLRLEVEEGKGLFAKDKVTFVRLKEAGEDLLPFENHFFNALFAYGDRVQLESLKNKFYVHLGAVQSSVKGWIHNQGWYESGQKKLAGLVGLGGVIAIGWGVFALFARQNSDGLALIGTGILMFFLSTRFNKRSPDGNKTYQRLEGFRRFVEKAERPVIERLLKDDPHYYDKTMPYALAFGYLKQWNRMFDGLLMEPPSWYGGPMMHTGSMHHSWQNFSESFPTEVSKIGSVFNSSPSSSGSGGGGGGGFSGGGSGGGGGGSW